MSPAQRQLKNMPSQSHLDLSGSTRSLAKAPEDRRSPRPLGKRGAVYLAPASWTAPVLWRFGSDILTGALSVGARTFQSAAIHDKSRPSRSAGVSRCSGIAA